MTIPKKPIPQAIPATLPQTAPELLAYIHNHVNAILGETRAFKFLPAGMTPEQYLGLRRDVIFVERKVIADGLLELERTGFAVSDHWREWLPRPADQGQTRMSSQLCYLWPLANYDDVYRFEVQVELAIKALTDGGLPPKPPHAATSAKRQRGRPRKSGDTKPSQDKKLAKEFKKSGKTYAAYAAERGLKEADLRRAVDRDRKRHEAKIDTWYNPGGKTG